MSLKDDALELTVAAVATLAVLWYVEKKISSGANALANGVASAASSAWSGATAPLDVGLGSTGNAAATSIVEAPAAAADALSFGTLGGNNGGTSLLDTLKSGPLGGLWGILTGDGNTNIIGPAPSAGIDYGQGAEDWSS